MSKCCNCEDKEAIWACKKCPTSDFLLCEECRELHAKIKLFRGHSFEKLIVKQTLPEIICKNCEATKAKYICLQCKEEDRYLCVGCSVFHSKVKAFRGHTSLAIYGSVADDSKEKYLDFHLTGEESTSSDVVSFALSKFHILQRFLRTEIDQIVENLSERSYHDFTFWQTAVFVTTCTFIYYLLSRAIFGKLSLLINALVAFGVLGNYRNLFGAQSSELGSVRQESEMNTRAMKNLSSQKQIFNSMGLEHEAFPNEFDYRLGNGPSKLRPRGKAYKRRTMRGEGNLADRSRSESTSSRSELSDHDIQQ